MQVKTALSPALSTRKESQLSIRYLQLTWLSHYPGVRTTYRGMARQNIRAVFLNAHRICTAVWSQNQIPSPFPVPSFDESLWIKARLPSPLPGLLRANMTSSTKPEVHNVSQRCMPQEDGAEPWPQVTSTEQLTKFRQVVSEICDRQTCSSEYSASIQGWSKIIKSWRVSEC